jgi:hypothetical protein
MGGTVDLSSGKRGLLKTHLQPTQVLIAKNPI